MPPCVWILSSLQSVHLRVVCVHTCKIINMCAYLFYFAFIYSLWGHVCRSERVAVTRQLAGAISLPFTWVSGIEF